MLVFCKTEAEALDIFTFYKNVGAYSIGKAAGVKIGDATMPYARLTFLPSDDVINGIIKGEIKLKKVIKKAIKAMSKPKAKADPADDAASIGIGMAMLVNQLTSDRKNKKGPPVIVVLLDEKDPQKSKIVKKYLNALLAEFGLAGVDFKKVDKLFAVTKKDVLRAVPKEVYKRWIKQTEQMKAGEREAGDYSLVKKGNKKKRKKETKRYLNKIERIRSWRTLAEKVREYSAKPKNGCMLSKSGKELKTLLMTVYMIELRNFAISNIDPTDLDRRQTRACAEILYKVYSAENLKGLRMRYCKNLSKKDRKAVKAYNSLLKILDSADVGPEKKVPKVKYGYYHKKRTKADKKAGLKKGLPTKAKTSKKKFMKFFEKKDNREFLVMLYAHTTLVLMGYTIGDKLYNEQMKIVCKNFQAGFGKAFQAAAVDYATKKGLLTESK